jgi:phosphoglucomutase
MIFIGGGEESYGYLTGEFVRDKDAVMASAMIAEAAAWAKDQKKTMFDLLLEIYQKYGFFKESLLSVTKKGKEGADEIQHMMDNFRSNPPKTINKSDVVQIIDYESGLSHNFETGTDKKIDLPKANVLQFFTKDGSKISIRPSGTEPKIKFYFGVKEKLDNVKDFAEVNNKADEKIKNIIKDLKL